MGLVSYALGMPEHHRERKEALEDEARQFKVKDLWEQRNAIRDRLSKLDPKSTDYQQGMAAIQSIQTQLDDIHDPIKNPGALQRDFEFIKGLITRKKPAPAAAAPQLTTTTPDIALPAATQPTAVPAAPLTIPGRTVKVTGPAMPAAETMAVPTPKVNGLIAPGNIPIWNRPAVQNADGTTSSEFSTSFTDENPKSPYYGKEVIVPTIVNGKFLTPDGKKPPPGSQAEKAMMENARTHYEQTGEHLGVFVTPASADKYADALHKRGDKKRPDASAYQTPEQRKAQARQERAQQEAQQFLQAGPLTPEQAAQGQIAEQLAKINIIDKLPGLTDAERQSAKTELVYAALGITKAPKYFSQLMYTTDAGGKVHAYRVPQDPTLPAEEIEVGEGQQPTPRTTGGKAAAGLKFDKVTGQVSDSATGKRYSEGDPTNPPEVQAMFDGFRRYQKEAQDYQLRLTAERGASYNATRPVPVLDTQNGNAPAEVSFSEMQKQPGRYIPASIGAKAISTSNMFEDIARTSRATRDAINGLKEDFPEDMKAKIAVALTADDHGTTMSALLASSSLAHLSDDQFQFLVAARQLSENAMSMRSILGAGQGSEDVRRAIQGTLPSLLSPNRKYALMQLDAFDKTLQQLHGAVQNVPLNTQRWSVTGGGRAGAQPSGGAQPTKGSKSLAAAMKLHPGWTEAQVIQDLQSHGYGYTRP